MPSDDRLLTPSTGRAAEIFPHVEPQLQRLYSDKNFKRAYSRLDVGALGEAFHDFTLNVAAYNVFHRRERRLWSIKIGTGKLDRTLEASFQKSVGSGKEHYKSAFGSIERILDALDHAGFGDVLERHLPEFTRALGNDNHPLTAAVLNYFQHVGCSRPMIDEFKGALAPVDFNLVAARNRFDGLREMLREGSTAQLKILSTVEKEGFSFLRGRCGPPAWAVTASSILASVGISIAAWVVVVIIVVLMVILVIICAAAPRGSWVRDQCEKLNVSIPVLSW